MVRSLQELAVYSDTSLDDLRQGLLDLGLVDALQQLVGHANHFLVHPAISILHVLDSYGATAAYHPIYACSETLYIDNTRAAILSSDIIPTLVNRSKTHHFIHKRLSDAKFHGLFDACSSAATTIYNVVSDDTHDLIYRKLHESDNIMESPTQNTKIG